MENYTPCFCKIHLGVRRSVSWTATPLSTALSVKTLASGKYLGAVSKAAFADS